jgi:membrane protein YqaA with SNARE-associated domain
MKNSILAIHCFVAASLLVLAPEITMLAVFFYLLCHAKTIIEVINGVKQKNGKDND